MTVIDGATNAVTTIQAGSCHSDVATDPTTNTIYVANLCSSSLAVIDGATNTVTATVPVGGSPTAVAVNPITHTVYVANLGNPGSPTLSVITVQPIPTSQPLPIRSPRRPGPRASSQAAAPAALSASSRDPRSTASRSSWRLAAHRAVHIPSC